MADKRTNRLSGLDSNIKRILNDPCLFLMANRVVAGDYLTDFTMMPRSFTGLHVFFRMGGGVAGDVGPADVTVKS